MIYYNNTIPKINSFNNSTVHRDFALIVNMKNFKFTVGNWYLMKQEIQETYQWVKWTANMKKPMILVRVQPDEELLAKLEAIDV